MCFFCSSAKSVWLIFARPFMDGLGLTALTSSDLGTQDSADTREFDNTSAYSTLGALQLSFNFASCADSVDAETLAKTTNGSHCTESPRIQRMAAQRLVKLLFTHTHTSQAPGALAHDDPSTWQCAT